MKAFPVGRKKRNEIFHMAILDPKLAILDETDSGLDIDALRLLPKASILYDAKIEPSF